MTFAAVATVAIAAPVAVLFAVMKPFMGGDAGGEVPTYPCATSTDVDRTCVAWVGKVDENYDPYSSGPKAPIAIEPFVDEPAIPPPGVATGQTVPPIWRVVLPRETVFGGECIYVIYDSGPGEWQFAGKAMCPDKPLVSQQ